MRSVVFKIAKLLIATTAVIQLAMSQVHIKVITKVFDTSIGFYLFIFILLGMVMTFNISSMKKDSNMTVYFITTIVGIAAGIKFLMVLFQDIATGAYLTFEDARLSIFMSIIALAVYFIFSVCIIITKDKKKEANE